MLNLRGKVTPIVDLRLKFEMPSAERTSETCIIVVEANGVQTGIVVDQVSEVVNIAGEEIEDSPAFGADVRTDFILGIGKSAGRVRLLLDIDRVLADNNLCPWPEWNRRKWKRPHWHRDDILSRQRSSPSSWPMTWGGQSHGP